MLRRLDLDPLVLGGELPKVLERGREVFAAHPRWLSIDSFSSFLSVSSSSSALRDRRARRCPRRGARCKREGSVTGGERERGGMGEKERERERRERSDKRSSLESEIVCERKTSSRNEEGRKKKKKLDLSQPHLSYNSALLSLSPPLLSVILSISLPLSINQSSQLPPPLAAQLTQLAREDRAPPSPPMPPAPPAPPPPSLLSSARSHFSTSAGENRSTRASTGSSGLASPVS